MKSFDEAANIVRSTISEYQVLCQNANKKVLSDTEAFFRNLNPFGRSYGGRTGFQRANTFITKLNEKIKNGTIASTQQLISFMAHYPDKGFKLSKFIWKSLREAAGFNKEHIDSLISPYQSANEYSTSRYDVSPSHDEARVAIEGLFNRAICGDYDNELLLSLNINLHLQSNECLDYGQKLLSHLNKRHDHAAKGQEFQSKQDLQVRTRRFT